MNDDPLSAEVGEPIEPYSDLDLMPFGKHVNERLQDVPAMYLHWLWSKRPISDKRLEAYIRNNLSALKKEHPDGIWT
jgi:uncharacterized protein (DUF3820 family)